jgi:hypothetical protein
MIRWVNRVDEFHEMPHTAFRRRDEKRKVDIECVWGVRSAGTGGVALQTLLKSLVKNVKPTIACEIAL